jgi:hypothetical protein
MGLDMADIGTPELLLLAVVFAALCGTIAHKKGRNTAGWAFLGLLFGPFTLLVVALLPTRKQTDPPD